MCSRILILLLLMLMPALPSHAEEFLAICYHDVQENVEDPEGMAVSVDNLVAHFSWLHANGYKPISIEELIAARDGDKPLPPKAVLLTFDDGFASFHSKVFPLLEAFDFPAVVAPVARWADAEQGAVLEYDGHEMPRESFMTWEQLREVAASELVEVASHSYDMHHGITANPQGNKQPAMTSFQYDPVQGVHEEVEEYEARIRNDFQRAAHQFEKTLGYRPRVMVWPYGKHNRLVKGIAKEFGMPITLTLDSGIGRIAELGAVPRVLMLNNPSLESFVWNMHNPYWERLKPRRIVHVDLDYVYDPDPLQQEENLGLLLDRIQKLGVNTVYLQAFADPDGTGEASSLYFPNRHLPVRADLFNRAAWQLKTRTQVDVYAWMPVLAYILGEERDKVQAWDPSGCTAPDSAAYQRLSPFSSSARQKIAEIYEDLAKHTNFQGILFHDDAFLSDYEDAHPEAIAAYREAGLTGEIGKIRDDEEKMEKWSSLKTRTLLGFTRHLVETVRYWQPNIKTARNMFALPVLEPESEAWYAQNLPEFVEHYDFTAIMAMPFLEEAEDPEAWLQRLAATVADTTYVNDIMEKVVFELQSQDWRTRTPVPTAQLLRQIKILKRHGAKHYGYYPDDFFNNHPAAEGMIPVMSLRAYPYVP